MSVSMVNAEQARYLMAGCKTHQPCAGRGCRKCGQSGFVGKPWGKTRISALKFSAGVTKRDGAGKATGPKYFFLARLEKYLEEHPYWSEAEVYKPKEKIAA